MVDSLNMGWVGSVLFIAFCLVQLFFLKLLALKIHETAQRDRLTPRTPGSTPEAVAERWEQVRRYVANEVTLRSRAGAKTHGS